MSRRKNCIYLSFILILLGIFLLKGCNESGNLILPDSTLVSPDFTYPAKIKTPVAGDYSANSIKLQWTKPQGDNFKEYRIFYSTNGTPGTSDVLAVIIKNSETVEYTVKNLLPETTYYFRIFTYNVTNKSIGSNTVSFKTLQLDGSANPNPVILNLTGSSVELYNTVYLSGAGTTDPAYSLSQLYFKWDTNGDGIYNTEFSKAYTVEVDCTSIGLKTVGMQVKNPSGKESTAFIVFEVIPKSGGNTPPFARFETVPSNGLGRDDTIFQFDASSSSDNETPDELLLFRWDRNGDGAYDTPFSSELINYSYQPTTIGEHRVILEVKDQSGVSSAYIKNIQILTNPVAHLEILNGNMQEPGVQFQFDASKSSKGTDPNALYYRWNYSPSLGYNTSFKYNQPYYNISFEDIGEYTMTVEVKNSVNLTDTATINFSVRGRPISHIDDAVLIVNRNQDLAYPHLAVVDIKQAKIVRRFFDLEFANGGLPTCAVTAMRGLTREIVIGCDDGYLYHFDITLDLLNNGNITAPRYVTEIASSFAGVFDSNDPKKIVFAENTTSDNYLWCITQNGNVYSFSFIEAMDVIQEFDQTGLIDYATDISYSNNNVAVTDWNNGLGISQIYSCTVAEPLIPFATISDTDTILGTYHSGVVVKGKQDLYVTVTWNNILGTSIELIDSGTPSKDDILVISASNAIDETKFNRGSASTVLGDKVVFSYTEMGRLGIYNVSGSNIQLDSWIFGVNDPRGIQIRDSFAFVADFGNGAAKIVDIYNGTIYQQYFFVSTAQTIAVCVF